MTKALKLEYTTEAESWPQSTWAAWDHLLSSDPSAHLDSRTIRAALNVPQRKFYAIKWTDDTGTIKGLAQVEDTHAKSEIQGAFLNADKPIFKVAQRYLYRDGTFQFPVRVMGAVLASGDHAFRFAPDVPKALQKQAIHEALHLPPLHDHPSVNCAGTPVRPKTTLLKDHYKEWGPKFAGNSTWDKKFIDLEFDPVMEIDIEPHITTFEEYTAALRKKPRTKIRKILKCSDELTIRNLTLEETEANIGRLHELYKMVYDRAAFTLGSLNTTDIVELKRTWGDDFPVLAYELEGTIVGFQCGMVSEHTTEAFFVGFVLEENKTHAIYQRMLLEFIKQALAKGSKKIGLGRTALDMKSSLGACPKRLACYMRVERPPVHAMLRVIAKASSPKLPELKRAWDDNKKPILAAQKN